MGVSDPLDEEAFPGTGLTVRDCVKPVMPCYPNLEEPVTDFTLDPEHEPYFSDEPLPANVLAAALGPVTPGEPILTCNMDRWGHVGLIMDGHCTICGEPADAGVDDGRPVAEVRIEGKGVTAFKPAPPCEHRSITARVDYAAVRANVDGTGPIVRREARVMSRCAECGVPLRWLLESAHYSTTEGPRALVCSMEAMSDTDAMDGWQTAGEG